MKDRFVWSQLAVFSVVSVLAVAHLLFNVVGIHLGRGPMTMTATLNTAGGIFEGSRVTYRGVEVGKVTSVEVKTDRVVLRLKIEPDARIPANAVATVTDLSAVGEQYLDFVPPAKSAPTFLADGSAIPTSQTRTPVRVSQVLHDTSQLVKSLDPADIASISTELGAAFADTGPELQQILRGTTTLVDVAAKSQPELLHLLQNSNVLLKSAAAHSADLDTFTKSLEVLSGTLRDVTPNIESIIDHQAELLTTLTALMDTSGAAAARLLADVATVSEIMYARIPALSALLSAVPAFGERGPKVFANGQLTAFLLVNYDQGMCSTMPLTSPLSGIKTPVHKVACLDGPVRGAVNAPRPGAAPAAGSYMRLASYDPQDGSVRDADGTAVALMGHDGGPLPWQTLVTPVGG